MGRYILKITDEVNQQDYYLEWSTIVDAPVTYGMPLDEFAKYYKMEYGDKGMSGFAERMQRVEEKGCSGYYPDDKLEEFFECNRAGDHETQLDKEGILDKYCRNRIIQL